jgi:hypothetical protein
MDDESSANSTPGQVGSQDQSNAKAAEKHSNQQPDNPSPLNTNHVGLIPWFPKPGIQILESSFVWIFWIIGSDLQACAS